MTEPPFSALRRQPALASVRGAIDQPVAADQPAVLLVGEADAVQPREHVLPELGAMPHRFARLAPHDFTRQPRGPARAIGQLGHAQERIDERVVDLDLVEAPPLSAVAGAGDVALEARRNRLDRKSTRLNSSHLVISYAVFCLKKKNK